MRELGWIEGKNVAFEGRYTDNRLERLPALAAELVRLNVDVIVANGNARVASGQAGHLDHSDRHGVCRDPLGSGLVASLARPGGDITGMSLMAPTLAASDWNCSRSYFLGSQNTWSFVK